MLKTIDLFAGAGGLSYGFESTGEFLIVAAAENNKNARKTYIENHKGIMNYDTGKLIVISKQFQIAIEGRGLCVEQYTYDTLKVSGYIDSIRFVPC